jgi:V/A-type H+-transporting ATPase subunit I
MIEPMKRVVVVATASAQEPMLEELHRLGVLHLLPFTPPAGQNMESLSGRIRILERALALCENTAPIASKVAAEVSEMMAAQGLEAARSLLGSTDELERSTQERAQLAQTQSAQQALGHFDPREIIALRQQGLFVRLYECSHREFGELQQTGTVQQVAERDGAVVLAHVSAHTESRLPLRELELPETSLTEIEDRIIRCDAKLSELRQRLDSLRQQSDSMRASLRFHQNALLFEQARAGMGGDQRVCYVQGFCPTARLAEISSVAARHGWAILAADPGADDPAPTLLKQSRWEAWFQPVMKFIGVTPGYREHDANGVLLVFFSLFVAMIIGDAGYGFVMLATTFFVARRLPRAARRTLPLFYILSAATIVWGALAGMWFGIRSWGELPVLRSLVLPSLSAFNEDNRPLMRFCLLLGAIHLSVAHGMAAVRRGSVRALGELGWALIIWGVYFVAGWLLLGEEHLSLIQALFIGGGLMVILFSEQEGTGFFRGIGKGLLNLPLNLLTAMGSFSDLISYIRLFAVGLATKEVAVAFNGMASQMGLDGVFAVIGSVLIVTLGHTLNLALAALGVLVHGVRLNLLEFSRHLNVSWSGIPYEPFRKLTAETASTDNDFGSVVT